ncbi:MAG: outer membrane beta-barrel domain-containing protein [Pseudomonadota bacterium]
MESRFQRIFLVTSLLVSVLGACSVSVYALETTDNEDGELGKIITPDIKRRTIKEADLNSENFEVGLFYGLLAVEDFGTNEVSGVTFSYHITENFFTEAAYGLSTLQKTSYELLSGGIPLLTDDQRNLTYYNLSLGYNLMPGQVYITKNWHFDTNIYFIAGAGNTNFADKNYFTYNFGAGLRFYATDWFSMDLSMRDYAFTHELFGIRKNTNNLEGRFGMSIYF